ncbi:MAG: hypothetical protein FDZ75_04970, partial [Actinobacteria bacterium]
MSRRIVVALALASVLALALAGCAKKTEQPDLGLAPGAKPATSTPATGSATATSSPLKPGSTSGSTGGGTQGGGSSSGATGSSGKGPQTGTEINQGASSMKVKLIWWNDTARKTPEGFEVVYK